VCVCVRECERECDSESESMRVSECDRVSVSVCRGISFVCSISD
jgi:hypothetical protein